MARPRLATRKCARSFTLSERAIRACLRLATEANVSQSTIVETAITTLAATPDLAPGEHAVIADPRGGYLVLHRCASLSEAEEFVP